MDEILYHVSDRGDIVRFEPRPAPATSPAAGQALVWAIDAAHLHAYLLPRDCPRVTFHARPDSHPDDVARLMPGASARHVVAIETGWLAALRTARLYRYDLPSDSFAPHDPGAGYYVSRRPVAPRAVSAIDDPLAELLRRDVELRVMPSLWPLGDAVAASTLQFSIIRMRNARPRDDRPPAGARPGLW